MSFGVYLETGLALVYRSLMSKHSSCEIAASLVCCIGCSAGEQAAVIGPKKLLLSSDDQCVSIAMVHEVINNQKGKL